MSEGSFINKEKYTMIGCMSGTSLDGLDIALCEFHLQSGSCQFKIKEAITVKYTTKWKNALQNAPTISAEQLTKLDWDFGKLIGNAINDFLKNKDVELDAIASHGHTVFHQPENGFTLQIGKGTQIVAKTKITTINDFRSNDVSLGGQGAPLVPIGDKLLFSNYEYCLNLGGFANVSFQNNENRIAFDICPVNILMNYYAQKKGKEYDENGEMAREGNVNNALLSELNNLEYYKLSAPKSLGKEWLDVVVFPVLNSYTISVNDKLRTIVEHAAFQITKSINGNGKILITGGGTHNTFLLKKIEIKLNKEIKLTKPSSVIIDYKEALIFAFLGLLKLKNISNCLASVTGAKKDNLGGVIYRV